MTEQRIQYQPSKGLPAPPTLDEIERTAIVNRLKFHRGSLVATARSLGISRTTLWRRLREYGVRATA